MRLTKDEILLVVFILMALVVGAGVKKYRGAHRTPIPAVKPSSASGVPEL